MNPSEQAERPADRKAPAVSPPRIPEQRELKKHAVPHPHPPSLALTFTHIGTIKGSYAKGRVPAPPTRMLIPWVQSGA